MQTYFRLSLVSTEDNVCKLEPQERFLWRQLLQTNHIWPCISEEVARRNSARSSRKCVLKNAEDSGSSCRKVWDVFGFDSLNKHQLEALRFVFDSKSDVFVNLPTGFGKSVVFQALLTLPTQEKNIVLVVSPSQPLKFTWNKRYITQWCQLRVWDQSSWKWLTTSGQAKHDSRFVMWQVWKQPETFA